MDTASRKHLIVAAVLAAPLLLAACGVSVREEGEGRGAEVDIRTPIGDLSVRTEVDASDTGLPVYPGAQPVRDEGEQSGSANVNIGALGFGVQVVAMKFESNDAPESIVDFYTNAMKTYGEVTECRGDIDFKGRSGSEQPVCDEKPSSRDIQLVTGTAEQHRIVDVRPRGSGTEFAVVYIQTRGRS